MVNIMNKQDVLKALLEMGHTIRGVTIQALKLLGIVLGVLFIMVGTSYCVVRWFWESLAVIGIGMLSYWFYMELDCARRQREWEEQCHVYWEAKRQPTED